MECDTLSPLQQGCVVLHLPTFLTAIPGEPLSVYLGSISDPRLSLWSTEYPYPKGNHSVSITLKALHFPFRCQATDDAGSNAFAVAAESSGRSR